MAESFVEKRKRELGLTSSTSSTSSTATKTVEKPKESDFITNRKMDLGLIPDTRVSEADTEKQKLTESYNEYSKTHNQFATGKLQVAEPIKKESTLQKISKNPIVKTAAKGLQIVGKVYDKVSHLPVINQATGLLQGAAEPFVSNNDQASDEPLWKKYLGNVKDAVNLTQNITNPASLITGNLIPSSKDKNVIQKGKAFLQAPKSAIQGAFNPDEARKNLSDSLKSKSLVTQLAVGSVADPLSYVPIPSIKGIKGASSAIGETFDRMFGKVKPIEAAPKANPILGLPAAKRTDEISRMPFQERIQYTDDLQSKAKQQVLLGEGDFTPPTRLKVNNPTETLDYVMTKIKPEVMSIIEAPARRDLLVQYIQKNTGYEMKDIINRPMQELQELGQVVQKDLHGNMQQIAFDVAKRQGHDLPALLEGQAPTLRAQLARDTQSQVYGVQPPKVGIQKPSFNIRHESQALSSKETYKFGDNINKSRVVGERPKVSSVNGTVAKKETVQPRSTTVFPDEQIKSQQLKDLKTGDELKFAQTVKSSENTSPELLKAMEEAPMTGARTTDILNRQEAAKMIEKHGTEVLYSKLLSKTKQFSPSETTAAQILAKHYSSLGGKENLSKAIELVSKTAKGGREMGQAIQALSQWDKLDETGALLLGERQLNRGVKETSEWKSLTTEQGAPITEAAQRIEKATETKNLADEVLAIVTNKQAGEALTDVEKATIKQFQDQVKLIDEKGKGILSKPKVDKVNETIKKVSQIEPKARTRDQVVSFLDAKAALARKRIAASRNVGFAAVNKGNPVIDYAIIGASHIAKGVVKLSDFTEVMVRDFGSSVKPHINEAFNKATNIFRRENGLPTVEHLDRVVNAAVKNERFTTEEAKQFKAWAAEIGHMSEGFKREATQDLQAAMKELGDSTLGDKIATIQTGAQLLNVVTIGRNAIGNAALIVSEKISKVSAVPIDWTLSKLTGERTIQFKAQNQEKLLTNFLQGTESGWKGVSPSGTLDSYGIHPNVFGKKNPLRYVTKSLGASMQGFDNAAYRQAYGDVLATYGEQMGKAQGLSKAEIKDGMQGLIEKLDKRIFDLADEAGLYATFQDETLLSQGAEMLKRGLNKITDLPMQKIVGKGLLPQKLSTEGFGLGDVVLKYAKTPANLIMRAIDYSPLGFIRGIGELAPLVFNKAKFNQFQATRSLSRAITGTLGLTGVGYMLADAGILTGSSSMDKDTRSIQEQSGQGAYKVNWSALTRFITSGLDKDAAKFQKGDHLMDYQWLQPAAISVAMGVNANRAVNDKKNGSDIVGWQIAQKSLLGGLQTILENPMVQGLSGVVDAGSDILKRQDPTKAKSLLKGVPATFVPTLLNQWRASTDNKQRETFSKNLLTEMGNLIKNKIPGVSKTLPISYDSLGNARERIQGGKENTVGQYLTAFFSPARMTEYQVSDEAKLVLDLMNQSGDASVLPRIANKYFKVKQGKNMPDMRVDLDAKQFSRLQKNLGEMVKAKLATRSDYLSNPNISLEHKVDAVKKILTDVGKKARENLGTSMGYKKKDIKS